MEKAPYSADRQFGEGRQLSPRMRRIENGSVARCAEQRDARRVAVSCCNPSTTATACVMAAPSVMKMASWSRRVDGGLARVDRFQAGRQHGLSEYFVAGRRFMVMEYADGELLHTRHEEP